MLQMVSTLFARTHEDLNLFSHADMFTIPVRRETSYIKENKDNITLVNESTLFGTYKSIDCRQILLSLRGDLFSKNTILFHR